MAVKVRQKGRKRKGMTFWQSLYIIEKCQRDENGKNEGNRRTENESI